VAVFFFLRVASQVVCDLSLSFPMSLTKGFCAYEFTGYHTMV